MLADAVSVLTVVAVLEGVGVYPELEELVACCIILIPCHPVRAGIHIKILLQLPHSIRQQPHHTPILLPTRIKKRVHPIVNLYLLLAVAMQIDHNLHPILFLQLQNISPNSEGLRRELTHALGLPLAVEIKTGEVATGVTVDDAVGV
jgi:hypothetical protein